MTRNVCHLTLLSVLLTAAAPLACARARQSAAAAPSSAAAESEFRQLASQIVERRTGGTGGANGTASLEESALQILDSFALETLNAPGEPKLDALNLRLASLVAQRTPAGQGYAVQRLGGVPPAFVLAANFGSSGPSALRLYARGPQQYGLTMKIDPINQPDYFDDFVVVLPIAPAAGSSDVVFVTVTGRTDEFATGVFAAWRLLGNRVQELWATDLLPRSIYEPLPDGVRITFCAEPDEDQPGVCRRMARERYAWDGAAWKRVEQTDLGPPKP